MHIVYKLIFTNRLLEKTPPYYYIGSKTNCTIVDGKIIDRHGKPYYGSSSIKDWRKIVKTSVIEVEIFYSSEYHEDLLLKEDELIVENNAVKSFEYFNKSRPTINNYADPDYATYKHKITGKTVRLPRNDPDVISGEYLGVTAGIKYS